MKFMKYLPGLASYRGRYLYLSALAFLIFCTFALINWKYINESSQHTRKNIYERNENSQALNQIINQYQLIRVQIYQFSLNPEQVSPLTINESITRLMELTSHIDVYMYDDIDTETLNNFIIQIPEQLHEIVLDFLQTRTNPELWIPAIRVMSQQLLPVNTEISNTLDEMIEDSSFYTSKSLQLKAKLLELKNIWLSMISEFRLLASNRMGIFKNSREGINNRVNNIDLYLKQSQVKLDELETLLANEEYAFLRKNLLPDLKQNMSQWIEIHARAKKLLLSKDWRSDIPALKKIDQLLNDFNHLLGVLSNELQKQSVNDIQSLDDNNRAYSLFFLLLGILMLVILSIIYLYIDRNILLPIARTTRALLLQSTGVSQELQISSRATETQQLVDAFNKMRQQINQRENRLDFIAHHDNLTNLPNRLMFNQRLEHAIQLTHRNDNQVALMLLDLDRFKIVNDTLGHLFGDKLLQQTAKRLKDAMRAEDTIARLGGDEFAIILENISSLIEVETFAKKIIHLFETPFIIDEQELHISTSIGITLSPLNSTDPDTLIRFADIAMYHSKNEGRNQYSFYSSELEDADESIINFENLLREAISMDQFELHYQPIVDITNERRNIGEALLRWKHPTRGLLLPKDFIPILDNSELLFELTCWVIRETAQIQHKIKRQLGFTPCLSINLPSSIFQLKQYRDKVEKLLLEQIEYPENYMLEVTEDSLITDIVNTVEFLKTLKKAGFHIALDDFGTGQSSLSHLRVFPIDTIKIDGEFVRDVTDDQNDANLVSAIISLAHDLGLSVIAEGVESQAQFDFLTDKGCHLFQGYFFSHPVSADEYLKTLKSFDARD
jgi:diguanylate cyclase